MIIYGFTVVEYPEIPETETVTVVTRVFSTEGAFDRALEALILKDDEEVDTFETTLE